MQKQAMQELERKEQQTQNLGKKPKDQAEKRRGPVNDEKKGLIVKAGPHEVIAPELVGSEENAQR